MFTNNLDERELQLLIVALRYWRTHRTDGLNRRTDPQIGPDTVDILLAKLMATASVNPATRAGSDTGRDAIPADR
jgi:hypothetical protein